MLASAVGTRERRSETTGKRRNAADNFTTLFCSPMTASNGLRASYSASAFDLHMLCSAVMLSARPFSRWRLFQLERPAEGSCPVLLPVLPELRVIYAACRHGVLIERSTGTYSEPTCETQP